MWDVLAGRAVPAVSEDRGRFVRFIRSNAIALVALVFAMTGTGVAATHYIITSTRQIKPSVLKALKGRGGLPRPAEFVFFDGVVGPGTRSPVFAAKDYTHVVFTATCSLSALAGSGMEVEVSTDGTIWSRTSNADCEPAAYEDTRLVVARYYRLTSQVWTKAVVIARFYDEASGVA